MNDDSITKIQRVMISSTARDLPEHRRKVMDACLSQGMFPIMMEHLPAADLDAIQISLRMVDQADIYIGIFADRYGYIPGGYDESLIEMEYNHAEHRSIPRLIFIINDEHPKTCEDGDAYSKAAKLKKFKERLCKSLIVNFFNSPEDLQARVLNSLSFYRVKDAPNLLQSDTSLNFSATLIAQMAKLDKTIEELTAEQFQILDMLRYQKRVAIAGCAGSGKTLIAVEKAIRLDKAGIRTMVLCHNKLLAHHIKYLLQGTGVYAIDFTSWVLKLLAKDKESYSNWSCYEEPLDEMLSEAFDRLAESTEKYEAVIIDEGQDFRDLWWTIIDAAFTDVASGILYIFYDDNQALLPHRSKYPLVLAPFLLNKNCRNAGEIFRVVRKFHSQIPGLTAELRGYGQTKLFLYEQGQHLQTLNQAVEEATYSLQIDKLVILTTEYDPVQNSMLYNATIATSIYDWQSIVNQYIENITLSNCPNPDDKDILMVQKAAHSILSRDFLKKWEDYSKNEAIHIKWKVVNGKLVLRKPSDVTSNGPIFYFFTRDDWFKGIPQPTMIKLCPGTMIEQTAANAIRLFTVPTFKGLEADGVILFIPNARADLEANSYVGTSRAKYLLHIVVNKDILFRIPQLACLEK